MTVGTLTPLPFQVAGMTLRTLTFSPLQPTGMTLRTLTRLHLLPSKGLPPDPRPIRVMTVKFDTLMVRVFPLVGVIDDGPVLRPILLQTVGAAAADAHCPATNVLFCSLISYCCQSGKGVLGRYCGLKGGQFLTMANPLYIKLCYISLFF